MNLRLIYCRKCNDVIKAKINEKRSCQCGMSSIRGNDSLGAVYSGLAVPFEIDEPSLMLASLLSDCQKDRENSEFRAYVVSGNREEFKPTLHSTQTLIEPR